MSGRSCLLDINCACPLLVLSLHLNQFNMRNVLTLHLKSYSMPVTPAVGYYNQPHADFAAVYTLISHCGRWQTSLMLIKTELHKIGVRSLGIKSARGRTKSVHLHMVHFFCK